MEKRDDGNKKLVGAHGIIFHIAMKRECVIEMEKLESLAKEFATIAHAWQRRKYTDEPYIVHPAEVADLVRSVPHTEAMLAAAWLHDTVEDCGVNIATIQGTFGDEVADLVGWLTDISKPEDGNRERRKAIDREHMANAPAAAQTVKLADLISNSKTIIENDPGFAKTYLREKRLLVDRLVLGDTTLRAKADAILTQNNF